MFSFLLTVSCQHCQLTSFLVSLISLLLEFCTQGYTEIMTFMGHIHTKKSQLVYFFGPDQMQTLYFLLVTFMSKLQMDQNLLTKA